MLGLTMPKKTKPIKRRPPRAFPAPGYYDDNQGPDDRRVYFVTGTTSGNRWFDREDTDGEWWTLTWTCVPAVEAAKGFKFSAEPPPGVPTVVAAKKSQFDQPLDGDGNCVCAEAAGPHAQHVPVELPTRLMAPKLTHAQARALRVDDLVLTVRTADRLHGWATIGDVIDELKGRPASRRIKDFGRRCARDLHTSLIEAGAPQSLLDQIVPDGAPPVALQAQFEKLVAKAARAGIAVVADADTIAIRLIPRDVVDRGDDLRQLGDVVRVHGACGGMTGSGGGHPHGVY